MSFQATQLLRNDHKVIKGLFAQAQAAGLRAPEMKEGVLREMFMLLEIHSQMEEQVFYPALRELDQTSALVASSYDEHAELARLIRELRNMNPHHEGFSNPLSELIAAVTVHVETEEMELFPAAEKLLGPQLEALGDQMARMKKELLAQPQYSDSLPERVQDPNGGEQMRKTDAA